MGPYEATDPNDAEAVQCAAAANALYFLDHPSLRDPAVIEWQNRVNQVISMQEIHQEWVKSWTDTKAEAARQRWDNFWNREVLGLKDDKENNA